MKTILVTGFAGSIGSELANYFLRNGYNVHGIDNSEWAVVAFPDHPNLTKYLGDFVNCEGRYDLVVHAAAYKHVDLIERNIREAFDNNVRKSRVLLDNTQGDMLFISTDKAVEPCSYYGETKQVFEEVVLERGGVVARLGNVIGSSGSVIPIWEEAIRQKKPIKVTNMAMDRYMIEGREAIEKVMRLYRYAKPGQVIIPEMGKPISLSDLLANVLAEHGFTVAGYPYGLEVIGSRPGEKLHEKLHWDTEEISHRDSDGAIMSHPHLFQRPSRTDEKLGSLLVRAANA